MRRRVGLYLLIQALLCLCVSGLNARDLTKIDTVRNQLVIPRPALESLRSLVKSDSDPIDTLDTANEHIKVVLFADNTWQYIKLPGYQSELDIFDKYWDTTSANPYKLEQ